MLREPVCLCSVTSVHQVFNSQGMEFLVIAQQLDDIPTQAIDIDPSTTRPFWARLAEKVLQSIVVQFILLDPVFRKIYCRNLRLPLISGHRGLSCR